MNLERYWMLKSIKIDGDIRYPYWLAVYGIPAIFHKILQTYRMEAKETNGQTLIESGLYAQFD